MPGFLAGLSAIGGLASQFASFFGQQKANRENRQFSEKMYKQQLEDERQNASTAYLRQLDLLQRQQQFELETSDPAYTMQRLQAAGLNPNLAYGNMEQVDSPSPSSAPQAGVGSANFESQNVWASLPQSFSSLIQAITPLLTVGENKRNIVADTELKGSQKLNTDADTNLKGSQKKNVEASTNSLNANIDKILSDIDLSSEQREKVKIETAVLQDYLNNVRPKEKAKLDAETKKILEDTNQVVQAIENTHQIFPEQLALLKKQLEALDVQIQHNKLLKEKLAKEVERFKKNFDGILGLDKQSIEAASNELTRQEAISQTHSKVVNEILGSLNSSDPSNDALRILNDATKMLLLFLDSKITNQTVPDYWNK